MQTDVKVGDIMVQRLAVVGEKTLAFEAANKMKRLKVGSLLVTNAKKEPYAIITEKDLVYGALAKKNVRTPVRSLASKPLQTIGAEADVNEAAKKMRDRGIKRLVVTDKSRVIGILSERDLIRVSPSLYDLIAERERAGWEPEYAKRIAAAKRDTVL